MLDPSGMYPDSFHPADPSKSKDFRRKAKGYSRTRRPTRYHLIDFGHSRFYDPTSGPPLDQPLPGGDKSAPEHQDGKTPCNPFPTDVYYLGNLVRENYMQVCVIFYRLAKHLLTSMLTRDTMASSSCNLLSPIWSTKIRRGVPTWMRSLPVLLKSETSSARGNFAPG